MENTNIAKPGKAIFIQKFNLHLISEMERVAPRTIENDYFKDHPFTGKMLIDYPLNKPAVFEIESATSIGVIISSIGEAYRKIYNEEEETSSLNVTPPEERGMCLNRNRTNGRYGIWGHDIEDLYIEGITVHDNGILTIQMGS